MRGHLRRQEKGSGGLSKERREGASSPINVPAG